MKCVFNNMGILDIIWQFLIETKFSTNIKQNQLTERKTKLSKSALKCSFHHLEMQTVIQIGIVYSVSLL